MIIGIITISKVENICKVKCYISRMLKSVKYICEYIVNKVSQIKIKRSKRSYFDLFDCKIYLDDIIYKFIKKKQRIEIYFFAKNYFENFEDIENLIFISNFVNCKIFIFFYCTLNSRYL